MSDYLLDASYRRGWSECFDSHFSDVGKMHHDAFCAALTGVLAQHAGRDKLDGDRIVQTAMQAADAYIEALRAREDGNAGERD